MADENLLETLLGESVNQVCFVMDYVEFHFNGPILRALAEPRLGAAGLDVVAATPAALVRLIGDTVARACRTNDEQIEIRFQSGTVLSIPIDASVPGGESAHLVNGSDGSVLVW